VRKSEPKLRVNSTELASFTSASGVFSSARWLFIMASFKGLWSGNSIDFANVILGSFLLKYHSAGDLWPAFSKTVDIDLGLVF
jgi:hypothetical protein